MMTSLTPPLTSIISGLTSYGSIPRCIHLRVLDVSMNQLSSLSSLTPLTSLQHLDLSSNQITSLGEQNNGKITLES